MLLAFYVKMLDPWPEDIDAPPTELQEIWMEVQTAHETAVRRMQEDPAVRPRDFHGAKG